MKHIKIRIHYLYKLSSSSSRSTIRAPKSNHRASHSSPTSPISTIPNPILKINITTQTSRIRSTSTPERRPLALHITPADLATRRKSINARNCRRRIGCLRGKRRRTVYALESYYGAGNSSATGSIRAVSDTVAEIDVGAETGWVWRGTSEGGVLG